MKRPGPSHGPSRGKGRGNIPGSTRISGSPHPSAQNQHNLNVVHCRIETVARPLVPIYVHPENVTAVQNLLARLQQLYYLPIDLSPDQSVDDSVDISSDSSVSSIEVEMIRLSTSTPPPASQPPQTPSRVSSTHATVSGSTDSRACGPSPPPYSSDFSDPPSPPSSSHSAADRMPTQKVPCAPQNVQLPKHFYTVTVGKMTGVFFENWEDIKPLVNRVSDAKYQWFPSYDAAMAHYAACYRQGSVRVVRNPGDHETYGPFTHAKQEIA